MQTFGKAVLLTAVLIFMAGCDSADPGDGALAITEVQVIPPADQMSPLPDYDADIVSGATAQFTAIARGELGAVIEGVSFSWSTSRQDVATVDPNGLVTAVRAGTVIVMATAQGVEGRAYVIVSCAEPIEVTADLTQPTTWSSTGDGCTDYVVSGVRRVEASLTVEPGTWVMFRADAALRTLSTSEYMAYQGTADRPIRLFGEVENAGFWRGIGFNTGDLRNEMTHVEIDGAGIGQLGTGASTTNNTAIGVVGNGRLALSHTTISNSAGSGIRATAAGTILEGFSNNSFMDIAETPVAIRAPYLRYLDEASSYMGENPHGQPYIAITGAESVSVNQTWPDTGIPIRFTGGSRHVIEAHLTIRPGATLEFTSAGFSVGTAGSITADGTDGIITFRGASGTAGEWQGLIFHLSTNVNNRFENVVISDAGGATPGVGGQDSNLRLVSTSRVEITNSTIRNSLGCGIFVGSNNNNLIQGNNTFENNAGEDICS